jgi:hypothetical protein
MALITINKDSVIIDRDIERDFSKENAMQKRAIPEDKTWLVAQLVAPTIENLMSIELSELQQMYLDRMKCGS